MAADLQSILTFIHHLTALLIVAAFVICLVVLRQDQSTGSSKLNNTDILDAGAANLTALCCSVMEDLRPSLQRLLA